MIAMTRHTLHVGLAHFLCKSYDSDKANRDNISKYTTKFLTFTDEECEDKKINWENKRMKIKLSLTTKKSAYKSEISVIHPKRMWVWLVQVEYWPHTWSQS